jgi:hypothetical protein
MSDPGISSDVLLTIIRESVSLFILLVFLVFSYRLLDRALGIFERSLKSITECLEEIAEVLAGTK